MYNKNMNYVVLDLEWNMGSAKKELKMMPFEIIEIGAVKLNSEKKETDRFSRLIRPRVYKKMHRINSSIVHLSNKDLKDAESFEIVYSEFQEFLGPEPVMFCTWGDSDLTELQRNIRFFNLIPLSLGPIEFLDVQKLYGYSKDSPKERLSLKKAAEELSIPETTGFHRALGDAIYTAGILEHIDKKWEKYTSFNTYHTPDTADDEILRSYGSYVKHISKCFFEKGQILKEKRIKSLRCPICGEKLKKELPWFTLNHKHYLTKGVCEKHGDVRSKIRIKKDEIKHGVYAVKTTRLMDREEALLLLEKYKKAEEKKEALGDQKSILSKSD